MRLTRKSIIIQVLAVILIIASILLFYHGYLEENLWFFVFGVFGFIGSLFWIKISIWLRTRDEEGLW